MNKKTKSGGGGGDMKQTGATMKGKSCSAGVTKAQHSAVRSFPVGYTHSKKSANSKPKSY